MNRPIRIGLIAEGETELGASIPYIDPEDGGQPIKRSAEGALHTLIRRELEQMGFPECSFVQRHPTTRERGVKLRTGHSVTKQDYLKQVVIVWQPEEVDMILIVVDADNNRAQRQRELDKALATIRENHLDKDEQPIADRSASGLAIRNFETWLLADTQTVSKVLGIELEPVEDLEALADTKERLEWAIAASPYLSDDSSHQRPYQVRWDLAHQIELAVIKTRCPTGYAAFAQDLAAAATVTVRCHPSDGLTSGT